MAERSEWSSSVVNWNEISMTDEFYEAYGAFVESEPWRKQDYYEWIDDFKKTRFFLEAVVRKVLAKELASLDQHLGEVNITA